MRLIRLPEVCARTGRSRTRIYEDIEAGVFPKPVKIGERAIAFVDAEVDDWIAARVAARDMGGADDFASSDRRAEERS